MSIANQVESLLDQRDYFTARIRELGGEIVDKPTFKEIVEAVDKLYGIGIETDPMAMPAYAAVYGGNTLVFGRGNSVPNQYQGKQLDESYRGVEEDSYGYSTIPWLTYVSNITTVHFDNVIRPVSTVYLFGRLANLTAIENINMLKTENVTSMYNMFSGCNSLPKLDLSEFNTSSVTNMSAMFEGCKALTNLDLSSFDTRNVTDMRHMFAACFSLENIDLSSFDTTNVTNMNGMFGCPKLTSLDVSSFDTSNVTNMFAMFAGCNALTALDLSGFNTSSVEFMDTMFSSCRSITELDLSSFDTSKVTTMRQMFHRCTNLKSIDLSSFNTSQVTTTGLMFYGCAGLTSLNLGSFDTGKVTEMTQMFYECSSLKTILVSPLWVTTNVKSSARMFTGCTSIVGSQGTTYSGSNVDKTYARIDEGTVTPGYLTLTNGSSGEGDGEITNGFGANPPGLTPTSPRINLDPVYLGEGDAAWAYYENV